LARVRSWPRPDAVFQAFRPPKPSAPPWLFSAVIKLTIAPVYILRKQIHYPDLLRLCCGGVPGVLLGFYAMDLLDAKHHRGILFMGIGGLVASMALYNLIRTLRRSAHVTDHEDRSGWLPFIALGIGTEVGFSSAGAGALGAVALLNLTPLPPARVVGTDVMFGLALFPDRRRFPPVPPGTTSPVS
jgi:uncharacterized membrane protein YfcA